MDCFFVQNGICEKIETTSVKNCLLSSHFVFYCSHSSHQSKTCELHSHVTVFILQLLHASFHGLVDEFFGIACFFSICMNWFCVKSDKNFIKCYIILWKLWSWLLFWTFLKFRVLPLMSGGRYVLWVHEVLHGLYFSPSILDIWTLCEA
jgi:hypothetical protein